MSPKYVTLSWCAEDVLTLAPRLTYEQAEEWLANNQKHIQDRLCELGWEVMETLLSMDGISLEEVDD